MISNTRTSLRGERLTVNADGIQQFITSLSAEQWKRLVICLSLDLIGAMPELLVAPPLGDTVDALWAPVYAFCLFQLFGDRSFLYKVRTFPRHDRGCVPPPCCELGGGGERRAERLQLGARDGAASQCFLGVSR